METTGALQLIVPLMLTVFFAKIVGDRYGVGIDDTHVRLRGAPVLDEPALDVHQQMIDDKLSVSELMTTSLLALPPVVPVRRLVDALRMCSHQAFPVTPEVEKALGTSGAPVAPALLRPPAGCLVIAWGSSSVQRVAPSCQHFHFALHLPLALSLLALRPDDRPICLISLPATTAVLHPPACYATVRSTAHLPPCFLSPQASPLSCMVWCCAPPCCACCGHAAAS
jgi:hypothetical protein